MAKRRRVGLFFIYDESWAGGFYYLLNIILSFNHLSENDKPTLVIFYGEKSLIEKIKDTKYPFLEFLPYNKPFTFIERVYAKFKWIFTKKYFESQYSGGMADFIFPMGTAAYINNGSLRRIRKVYWIPDFQHKHLPHFFSAEEIAQRDRTFSEIAGLKETLVLSSQDAKADFLRHYPANQNKVVVVPFASVLPAFEHNDIQDLLKRYSIRQPYFMAPNQFWAHKNHVVLLKAAVILKEKGLDFQIVFTGKETDYRNADYVPFLKEFVRDNGLGSVIKFLGFIERSHQLQLMKHALVIVQPSLFEGWSTVVEDTKALNQGLILSDLRVHREQCGNSALYFEPTDEKQLAECMGQYLHGDFSNRISANYEERILEFAQKILIL
jgi:glycosyltransferase involved in cell wall biosynthesis